MPKPRVLISTDIGGSDKDDAQSFAHALLYADKLDYRGFVETRSDDGGLRYGQKSSGVEIMKDMIDAYGKDLGELSKHGRFPSAESLRAKIADGAKDDAFPGKLSEGAKLIIEEARDASPSDPLYVLTWGPIHDAAAALLAAPDIVDSVRLFSIAGANQGQENQTAYNALRKAVATDKDYKDLWWIDDKESFSGIYADARGSKKHGVESTFDWAKAHVDGAGALGELLFEGYVENFSEKPGQPKQGLKMGDTPSLLYLIDGVDDDNPGLRSWGGSYEKDKIGSRVWTSRDDPGLKLGDYTGAKTVFEHKAAFMADFGERLGWLKKGGGSVPDPKELPKPPKDKTPDGDGDGRPTKTVFFGDEIKGNKVSKLDGFSFEEGDKLIFHEYDRGTFSSVKGGNPVQTNQKGTFARIDSLVDLQELAEVENGVEVRANYRTDQLTMRIDGDDGRHTIVLDGLGRDFVDGFDDALF